MRARIVLTSELKPDDVVREDDADWKVISTHKTEGGWHVVLEGWQLDVTDNYTWLKLG